MARIRTIKPELAAHEGLFDLEKETGLPVRFAWCMLFTVADREGRFVWRPRTLKAQILPHDDVDFSRVLDAWVTRGFIVKYRVKGEWFGWIPTFTKHQVINNREAPSGIPSVEESDLVYQPLDACGTRDSRVADASTTCEVHAQAEGKEGREGKEGEGNTHRAGVGSEGKALPTHGPESAWRDITECDSQAYEHWLQWRLDEHDIVPPRVRIQDAKFLAGKGTAEQQRAFIDELIRRRFKRLHDPSGYGGANGTAYAGRKTYDDYARESEARLAALPGDDPGPM